MKRNYKNTIAVDLDGVVFDFESEFCDRFGYDNRHLFDLHSRYPKIDKDLINEFVSDPEVYENLLPIFGGILFLRLAKRLGFYIWLVTSRPKHLAEVTRNQLEGYDVPFHDITYTVDKSLAIQEYNEMYPNRPVRMLVDDSIKNLNGLNKLGIIPMAWEQPWNTGWYPRVRYNEENMKIEARFGESDNWKPFWENEDGN